jgi:hypothetical protein
MQLNGGMTVTQEEVNAMMDDAALDECVAPPPPVRSLCTLCGFPTARGRVKPACAHAAALDSLLPQLSLSFPLRAQPLAVPRRRH